MRAAAEHEIVSRIDPGDASMKLFDTTVSDDELDRAYIHLRDSEYCEDDRTYLEGLWAEYEAAADSHFHDQIQRKGHFASRVWEMRLAIVLKRAGLPVDLRRRNVGPDILVESVPRVWIEAVAPATTERLEANDRQAASQRLSYRKRPQ